MSAWYSCSRAQQYLPTAYRISCINTSCPASAHLFLQHEEEEKEKEDEEDEEAAAKAPEEAAAEAAAEEAAAEEAEEDKLQQVNKCGREPQQPCLASFTVVK